MSESQRIKIAAKQYFYDKVLDYFERIKLDAESKLRLAPPRSEQADIYRGIMQVAVEEKRKIQDHLTYLNRL